MNDTSTSQGAVPLPWDEESSVHDSELRFRALVIATSTMVYRMSPDWKELRELSGKGFLEALSEPSTQWLEKYVAVEDRPGVLAAIDKAIQQKSVFELEHRIKLADGSVGWTESRAVPIFSEDGELLNGLARQVMLLSITARMLACVKARMLSNLWPMACQIWYG